MFITTTKERSIGKELEIKKIIKNKIGLLELAKQHCNVSRACNILGYSQENF
jgi:hypothetical protein